jgi:hypothetical protein
MRYCERMLPGKPYYRSNKSDHTITPLDETRYNRLEFWHGQHPEDLEGEAVYDYLLDEVAKMKQQVYDSAVTTMTKTRGKLAGVSTPRGRGWHYAKCMDAKERMDWCLKNNKTPTHIYIQAPTTANPHIPKESIQEAKRSLPDRLFRQYYLAEFVDDGAVFNFRHCIKGPELSFDSDENQLWSDDTVLNPQVCIGSDWGKSDDYTVFTAWDITHRRMIGFMRFRFIDYVTAVRNLVWFTKQWNDVLEIEHDKTGIGNVIDDLLSYTDLPYEGVVFTNKEKARWVNNLMIAFERRIPRLPNWGEMAKELDAYEVKVSEIGNFKYAAAQGFHDDIVSSMLLGWNALERHTDTTIEVVTLDQLEKMDLDSISLGEADQDFESWKARI